jgi:hypothetical protein
MDPSDDGKVINGSTIVWLYPPGAVPAPSKPITLQDQAAAPISNPGDPTRPAGPASPGGGTGSASPVYTPPPKADPAPPTPAEKQAEKAATQNAAAASLKAAAENGVPFCEECEAARKAAQQAEKKD